MRDARIVRMQRACALLLGLSAAWTSACGDPVREARIEALGPERPGVAAGALHRPGQPCLACHDGEQPDVTRYTVAGTVFESPDGRKPAPGVRVELIDARGEKLNARTNCAGNFFVTPDELEPVYPLWTSLRLGDYRIDMQSPIGRDGSCASCHVTPASQSATDAVYLYSIVDTPVDRAGCK